HPCGRRAGVRRGRGGDVQDEPERRDAQEREDRGLLVHGERLRGRQRGCGARRIRARCGADAGRVPCGQGGAMSLMNLCRSTADIQRPTWATDDLGGVYASSWATPYSGIPVLIQPASGRVVEEFSKRSMV